MATVYCLQHGDYLDKPTGVEFQGIEPREARKDEDELGRVTRFYASGVAQVDDEEALAHFRARPWLFHVVERKAKAPEPAEGWRVEHRAGPWHDVVRGEDDETERANEKALSEEDALKLCDELNGGE